MISMAPTSSGRTQWTVNTVARSAVMTLPS
jgi:hypothetical protein